ncbi:E3 ubiquitin-protein ligase TRIM39-like [Cheilinus undulatus]|uniref:E3 ubiquitin-protein ligase TRIM39-like n=1 Tax=Cheilinus undulatus TaxID=241271 RepID=UPI001BD3E862|nr:E3 ubiquitin-protein ligase TRIM39-like [Cheilinus undulatus]
MSCTTLLPVCFTDEEDEGLTSPPWCVDSWELCKHHEVSLSLFCLDDLEPLCKQCAAESHAGHRAYPLNEAATDCKEELKTSLNGLKNRMVNFEKATQTWEQASRYNKAEAKLTEEQMKKDFESLHQFLREEEAARLLSLRENEEEKEREAHEQKDRINQMIKSLEEKIHLVEEVLNADGDGAEFLEGYEDTMNSASTGSRETLQVSTTLIDVSKHLGNLQYSVWEKMKDIAPYTPVIFDSRTAGQSLRVSPGLNSVHITPGPPQGLQQTVGVSVPETAECFHPYHCILAREGFDSGVHCWGIKIGDSSNWIVGVAAQSVSRRTEFEACPEAGLWCISLQDGKYRALTSPPQDLDVDESLHLSNISVRLDWDEGTLEFTNEDNNTHLFTFRHCFKEKVYPYFECVSEFGGFTVLAQRVNVSVGSDYVPVEDTEEDCVVKSESFPEERNNNVSSTCSDSIMSECRQQNEDKTTVICSAQEGKKAKLQRQGTKGKQVKAKCSEREKTKNNKPDVNKQSSKLRFSVKYHVSLNRALEIINRECGNTRQILMSQDNPI